VPPYKPQHLPYPPGNLETELHLRIQEVRAFDEPDVANCLQDYWDEYFSKD
jgi:hypothetical protein